MYRAVWAAPHRWEMSKTCKIRKFWTETKCHLLGDTLFFLEGEGPGVKAARAGRGWETFARWVVLKFIVTR